MRIRLLAPLVLAVLIAFPSSAQLIISEFRVRGPNGANDEFIELYNNSGADHTVAGGGTGYAVAASNGVARCVVPNGTIIPANGHYLCVNSVGYSLASYPAGNGTTATGDATYTTDIPDNAGIAIFNTSVALDFVLANRMDAVGSTAEANTTYKEGTGYPALGIFSIDYSLSRDECGKNGSITTFLPCPSGGVVADTNNNAANFIFVDPNGTSAGAGQRLGAPGPENLSSPISFTPPVTDTAIDSCSGDTAFPNVGYFGQSLPADDATFGSLDVRRRFTNTTGSDITRMRFRVIDLTTFPAPSGIADLRLRTSPNASVFIDGAPCGTGFSNVMVQGTTLEEPPGQPNGGAFHASMSAGTVTLGTPLANGASIDLRFLIGLQQHGSYKVGLLLESLPGASQLYEIEGCTDGCTGELEVVHSATMEANPSPPGSSVDFRVTFNRIVTGVDASDFTLTTTGTIAGAAVTGVVQEPGGLAGLNFIVTVSSGTGSGTLRLDVVDNDSISAAGNPLGGAGAGNGNFTAGEFYLLSGPPNVASITRADPNPTMGPTVDFTVSFTEPVTGVDAADFALVTTGTVAGSSIGVVSGGGLTWNVSVNTGTGEGTIRLDVIDNDTIIDADAEPLGGIGAGNGNFTTGEAYTLFDPPNVVSITRIGTNPTTAGTVEFLVTFDESVTGVDPTDFTFTTTGTVAPTILLISGSGSTRTVTVSTGGGEGTIRLNVIDNDSIIDVDGNPLGGPGAGNGDFTGGEVFAAANVAGVPALDPRALMLLAMLLAGVAIVVLRQ
ncbi:MAG TPA: lamin tail domain-containing protein [Thermoanaerobaculia bacterium]|nr:lamin tail domain-containing protein [Thermoanaerobaculia bacterium]